MQPAVQELGKSGLTLAKFVNVCLSPISVVVWGFDQIKTYIQSSLVDKLKNVPEENVIPPDPSIAVPTIEALRYTGHNKELRDMFSNLLASSMDKATVSKAHPSFVEIIKQINSDEARIIKLLDGKSPVPIIKIRIYDKDNYRFAEPLINFSFIPYQAECTHPELGPSYLENIERLGLASISYTMYNTNPNAYDPVENHPEIKGLKSHADNLGKRFEINRGSLNRTSFGENFYESCVLSK